jgi:hypothetical protein
MGACVFRRRIGCKDKAKKQIGVHVYTCSGLIVHDLRRSAIRNLVRTAVPEKNAMAISCHKTESVFDRYPIVSTEDLTSARHRVEVAAARALPTTSKTLVKISVNVRTQIIEGA